MPPFHNHFTIGALLADYGDGLRRKILIVLPIRAP